MRETPMPYRSLANLFFACMAVLTATTANAQSMLSDKASPPMPLEKSSKHAWPRLRAITSRSHWRWWIPRDTSFRIRRRMGPWHIRA
jgi:hypothetical protein